MDVDELSSDLLDQALVDVLAGDDELSAALAHQVAAYAAAAVADNTRRAYGSDWNDFSVWCADHRLDPLPAAPATVAAYAVHMATTRGLAAVTISRRMSALAKVHEKGGHPSPTRDLHVREVLAGIRRTMGTAPEAAKSALTGKQLRALLEEVPVGTLAGLRDRALLLVGLLGGFRRSELSAQDIEDVEWREDGLVIHIGRSKTDQEGQGELVAVPRRSDAETCPVRTLRAWLDAAGIVSGPIWRPVTRWGRVLPERMAGESCAEVVKRGCRRIGLDPDSYAGHSLRAGMATSADEGGASLAAIMAQGRWKTPRTAARYVRRGLFRDNAASKVVI